MQTSADRIRFKSKEVRREFEEKYPHVKKFFDERGIDLGRIRQHSAKIVAAGALTGTLFLTPPVNLPNLPQSVEVNRVIDAPLQRTLIDGIKNILPSKIAPLSRSQEKTLEKQVQDITGIPARASLEGEHLNTIYGVIGAEQHLMRFPGDRVSDMAPGKGAWGYVPADKEKWYAVVQTLYLPDWSKRQPYLRDWYKYRKVIIVNTVNGNAVVADIADSGPAAWTGKHFGGSPEVMESLGGDRYKFL